MEVVEGAEGAEGGAAIETNDLDDLLMIGKSLRK